MLHCLNRATLFKQGCCLSCPGQGVINCHVVWVHWSGNLYQKRHWSISFILTGLPNFSLTTRARMPSSYSLTKAETSRLLESFFYSFLFRKSLNWWFSSDTFSWIPGKKMAEKINLSNLSQDQAARKKYSCRILLQEICFSKLFWNSTVWGSFAWIWIFKCTKSILLKNICLRLLRTPQFL